MKEDRFDTDDRVEGVLLDENRTGRKVDHMKAFMKVFVFDIVRCFLQGNDMPLSCNLFLDGIFITSSGPKGSKL